MISSPIWKKKEFLNSFVERVDIYEQEQPDGRFLKHIKFRFPVYFGDRETQELCQTKVVFMSRVQRSKVRKKHRSTRDRCFRDQVSSFLRIL